jgi:hypothetical protein
MCLIGMPKRLFIKESVMRGFGRGFVVNLEELAVLLEYAPSATLRCHPVQRNGSSAHLVKMTEKSLRRRKPQNPPPELYVYDLIRRL